MRAQTPGDLRIVSSASYLPGAVAPGSLVSALGSGFNDSTVAADPELPLPASLGGRAVTVSDSGGASTRAAILFVSPTQVNFVMPSQLPPGAATVTIADPSGATFSGSVTIAPVAPSLFTADGSAAVSEILHLDSGGTLDTAGQSLVFLYGTGMRDAATLEVTANGHKVPVLFVGPEGGSRGLDQVNVQLPSTFARSQPIELMVTADGQLSNTVRVAIE